MKLSFDMSNRILLAVDSSNFMYYCISIAFSSWCANYKEDASLHIKPIKETDQNNLPNIIVSKLFRRELGKVVQKRLESILWIVKNNHQEDVDLASGIDVIFTEDDGLGGNFRKIKCPEYKANRKFIPRNFDMSKAKDYVRNVLFKELGIEEKLGYRFVRVPNCESDDIIATLMKRFTDYRCRIILSSDRDFLQLRDVYQYNLGGQRVERVIKKHEDMVMTPDEFRLWKIIRGDISDNIKGVFPKYGDVKSYRLVKDKPTLRQMLSESQEAANRYLLNKYLIDFKSIPEDVEEKIYNALCEKMKGFELRSHADEFILNECMDI